MAKILYGTNFISEDEPCLLLEELNLQSPGSKGFHRYEIIKIIRNDKPVEYRRDMGPAKKWKGVDQLRILGGAIVGGRGYIEETVGSLRLIAEQLRFKPTFDKRELLQLDRINV